MTSGQYRLGVMVACVPILLGACTSQESPGAEVPSDPWGVVQISSSEPIRIGLSVSAGNQALGQESLEMERGAEIAAEDYASLTGKQVEIVVVDTPCTIDGGVSAAEQLVSDNNLAGVVGPFCQNACLGAVDILESASLSAVSGTCGPDELFQSGQDGGVLFRTIYSDSIEGAVAAQFAYSELGARRAVIVRYPSRESQDFASGFQTRLEALGGLVVDSLEIQPGTKEFRVTLATISGLRPDVIYVALLPEDAAEFVASKGSSFLAETPLVANRFAWSTWFAERVGASGTGTYATGPNLDAGKLAVASTTYSNKYGTEPSSALFAYTYDALHLLLQGIRTVGILTPNGEYYIGRQSLNEAIRNTAALDGVTGELTCTPWGDCAVADVAVGRLGESGWTTVFVP